MEKLLIANRGEIAVRIIRAAKEMGITTVLAHSSADANSLAAKMADECVQIGPAQASKSYLNAEAVLTAAKETGADAIHPGYGFLAENANFARAVEAAGLIFVGPTAETIALMGDKAQARSAAIAANVPVVPGSHGALQDAIEAEVEAARIGYPLMIKAAAGGGGKGIRIVENPQDFAQAFAEAQREGKGAFGDAQMYLERFIPRARHVEVQILGDGKQCIHLYDRECSLQRRRQKILEEAPSPALDYETREALCASAAALARSVQYRGAGTLEYLYDETRGEFYFIEMNTRIQVEHPITEMITGVDLIRAMLRIASDEALPYQQQDIHIHGHAVECRINAENPDADFMPNIGTIEQITWPQGAGVRIDSMLFEGYSIPPFYDSMLAKIIVWDENRTHAFARLTRALAETEISGLHTTLPLHRQLAQEDAVLSGNFHTNWLESYLAQKT